MFTCYQLTEKSKNLLLEKFPPKYERVICHHITEQFGVPKDTPPPPMPDSVKVIGYVDSGDGVEGLTVTVNGTTDRPAGGKYHITLSIGNNRTPVETNKYLDNAIGVDQIDIDVTPKVFW